MYLFKIDGNWKGKVHSENYGMENFIMDLQQK
jgi:hypothetical protein